MIKYHYLDIYLHTLAKLKNELTVIIRKKINKMIM